MNELNSLIEALSRGNCIRQVLVMTAFFVTGFLFCMACRVKNRERILYAYPAGLALFALSGYMMLCLGIPFGRISVVTVMLLIAVISLVISVKKGLLLLVGHKREEERVSKGAPEGTISREPIKTCVVFAAFILISFILCLNVFKVAVDNDSFYFFSVFPNAIVSEGRYAANFDSLLTDAAPIGSIVFTLPYLFGFSETFGIMYMTDLCMLLVFAYLNYSCLEKQMDKKGALVSCIGITLFLATSSAYLTSAKWVMAGVYFMSYYFFTLALGYEISHTEEGIRPYALMTLFIMMTAMLRHEGFIMVLVLILSFSALKGFNGRELLAFCVIPVILEAILYYIRIFVVLKIDPLYAFLTREKACVMIAAGIAVAIWVTLPRNRLPGLFGKYFIIALPLGLLLLNLMILILRHERFLTNLYMFYYNIRTRAGWGLFGYEAFLLFIILLIKALIKKEGWLTFFDSLMISYVLAVLIVCYGRGDNLRQGIGDSGNRVLLTAVPIMVLSMSQRLLLWRKPDE